jgi:phosphocarrier protein FPr
MTAPTTSEGDKSMKQLDMIVQNSSGLHARPARVFVDTAKQFQADIRVEHGPKKVNAKSVISVLTLGVECGGQIRITADGPDEEAALEVLKTAVEAGLGDKHPAQTSQPKVENKLRQAKPLAQARANGATETGPTDGIVRGIAASVGIAIGPLYRFQQTDIVIQDTAADPAQETTRLQKAVKTAQAELEAVHAQMLKRVGAEEAAIFEAHLAILDDPELLEATSAQINAGRSAARAWQETIETRAAQMAGLKNETLAARAADIRDVGQRVLRVLVGADGAGPTLPDMPVVLVARDLSPSDTATFEPGRVLGFCTAVGGANAHTAILARALGLPAVVGAGAGVLALANGTPVILDGEAGTLTIEPDADTLATARKRQQAQQARREAELQAAQAPAITQDDHRMEVVANIGNLDEARQARAFGAEGVGLLRTEFLFLERADPPTATEQFEVYRDIAVALEGHPVIIRTLDVGGDKPLVYLPLPPEENPFLGQRGIRLCLARPDLLETQLRAILQAAEFGPCRIMFPMVAHLDEWRAARQMVERIRNELKGPAVELGIMVEVPAAALLADSFAREVDFFSIGTNDLTQYTLAMDRTHPALSAQADGLHPAVLRLIDQTVRAAHAAGKWVGVCGELGADPQAVPILVGLGVDELSVSVPAIPGVKAQIRSLSLAAAQQLAAQALTCATAKEVRQLAAAVN